MIKQLTKEQEETFLMDGADVDTYLKMKRTAPDTQHQFCEQFIKTADRKAIIILLQSVLEQILKLGKHRHTEIRDEDYAVFSETDMDDL